jgi:3-oxoacyl-ACP reductase-like protein
MRVQDELDSIQKEHGENYLKGIQPVFDPLKARHFDSAWNWVRQTALEMFFDMSVPFSLSQNVTFFLSCS